LQHLAAGRVLVCVVRAEAAGKGQHAIANIAHCHISVAVSLYHTPFALTLKESAALPPKKEKQ